MNKSKQQTCCILFSVGTSDSPTGSRKIRIDNDAQKLPGRECSTMGTGEGWPGSSTSGAQGLAAAPAPHSRCCTSDCSRNKEQQLLLSHKLCQQSSSQQKHNLLTPQLAAVLADTKTAFPLGNLPSNRGQHHHVLHLLSQFQLRATVPFIASHFNWFLAPFPVGNGCHHFLTR